MSRRRKSIAQANVNTDGTYNNFYGFGPAVHVGPGRYDLPGDLVNQPELASPRVYTTTGVVSPDGMTPVVLTLLAITPGTTSVLITALDGTPTDAPFSVDVKLGGVF